jgi:hypothetical protein
MHKSDGLKWIFLGLIAATFLSFVMGGVTLRQEIARLMHKLQAPPVVPPSLPVRPGPYPPTVYPTTKPPVSVKQAAPWQPPPLELLGKWQGGGATTTGFFIISMEISPNTRNPGQLLGFVTMVNFALPVPPLGRRQYGVAELVQQRMPYQISLVGTPSDDGGVAFHVEKTIGPKRDCPMTDMRVTAFGTEGIVSEWKGAACPGGSLVLRKQ